MSSSASIAGERTPLPTPNPPKQRETTRMQLKAVALRAVGPLIGEIPPPARRRRIPSALAAGRHRGTEQREPAAPVLAPQL